MAEIKNLKKAANRILKAVESGERIVLYGDADVDGISSIMIIEEGIEQLGGRVADVYFIDREKEGYGINQIGLNYLKKHAPALFIVADCGIGNFKEVELALKMGFEVIIIDHHEVLGKLPRASIIVDPKQNQDRYPFKEMACVGICYKLVQILLSKEKKWLAPERFLELAALGTVADQMPQVDDNRKLISEGILALGYTQRVGLKALMELTNFKNESQEELRQKIISPLNSAEPQDHSNQIYLLLKENDLQKAKKIAKTLLENSERKREDIQRIYEEAEERVELSSGPIVFEGDPSWHLILLGPVASRLCQKYQKPIFLYRIDDESSQGAVRTPVGIDGVKIMRSCDKLLETYGGHPLAAGFKIKNDNLEKFKLCLTKGLT